MNYCESSGHFTPDTFSQAEPMPLGEVGDETPDIVAVGISDHSKHYGGRIRVDDSIVTFSQERPHEEDEPVYYFLTGLGGSKEAIAVSRCVAARENYVAHAVAASHNQNASALEQGAKELTALVNKTEIGKRKRIMGLSMGGAITALAADQLDDVEIITLLAPGGMVSANPGDLAKTIMGNVSEVTANKVKKLVKDPVDAFRSIVTETRAKIRNPLAMHRIAIQGIKHTFGRSEGFIGEVRDLIDPEEQAKVHESVRRIAASPSGPHIRVVSLMGDLIINPRKLDIIARELGVDEVVRYEGPFAGHMGSTFNRAQTEFVLALDRSHTGSSQSKPNRPHAA